MPRRCSGSGLASRGSRRDPLSHVTCRPPYGSHASCDGQIWTDIKTGPDLSAEDLARARWPLARAPHLLETSLPGVFAVGDVRCGNVKRVASAVGEGSIAVSFVHQVLHE